MPMAHRKRYGQLTQATESGRKKPAQAKHLSIPAPGSATVRRPYIYLQVAGAPDSTEPY